MKNYLFTEEVRSRRLLEEKYFEKQDSQLRQYGEVKMNTKLNKIISLTIFYALAFTFIIPAEAKPVPADSVFNQNENIQNDSPQIDESFGNIPVYFEENQGQFNSKVKYFARGTSGYSLFLTATEAVYVLSSPKSEVQSPKSNTKEPTLDSGLKTQDTATAVYMSLVDANENSSSVGITEMSHKTNYFKGNDESKWRTEIPNFRQIQMNNVYQGIDTVWHGKENGGVQYDFVVKPNANPNQIEWEIKGAESVVLDGKGTDLIIKTEHGTIKQQKPFTYQETNGLKQEVESNFRIEQKSDDSFSVKFEVGNYDRSKTLTIDPSVNLSNLSFSTFLGGGISDSGIDIAVDRAGHTYITGSTSSPTFPTTSGSFDPTHNGGTDAFVTKINANGRNLIYSTFIGGDAFDAGYGIAVDVSGNAFITGRSDTGTVSFPTTSGAYDETPNGSSDVFAAKLNSDGSSLVFSTLIGGTSIEYGNDIAIDSFGNNVYITGETFSSNYPTTTGAFDESHNGTRDVFVTVLRTNGEILGYSTFLGGGLNDRGYGIAVDSAGNAYVTGVASTAFPTTPGAYNETTNGGGDVFVTKLNQTGSALIYSTYIGGSANDEARNIAVDQFGNAFVVGFANGAATNYPTTTGAFDETHDGSGADGFVTKLNSTGSGLVYSTFIGSNGFDQVLDIVIAPSGRAFVSGGTASINFPTTTGAYDVTHNGSSDLFVAVFNINGTDIHYSTFIGGTESDIGAGIAADTYGNLFVTGNTVSANYPTTSEAFQSDYNGEFRNAFVSKLGDYSISGRTVDTSGNALANSSVGLSVDANGFMLSDGEGYFYFGDTLNSGSYLLAATQTLYNFNPSNVAFNLGVRNKQFTFIGRPTTSGPTSAYASLGGNVKSQVGNVGLANTKLTLIDAASGNATVVHSDANGDYEFEGLLTGTFLLVVPEKEGYDFNPGIYQVNHLQQDLGRDFIATPNAPRPVNDFDGDGKSDLAVYRPNEGTWYILESESGNVKIVRFGLDGDIPVASDYDGDNRADIAVYRPSVGNWYRINSSNDQFESIHFGSNEDKPVQADFDGDGKTDYAVYRPSTGVWHRLLSEDGSYSATQFGISTDQAIAADYDSDGKADLTIYRNGVWYHQMSADNSVSIYQFGLENDKPMRGDFDGDGTIDTAVYRLSSGVWYWIESSDSDIQAKQFGISTDIPTPADYNGDGRYEQSVFRNGTWYVLRNDNSFYTSQFGQNGDIPIN